MGQGAGGTRATGPALAPEGLRTQEATSPGTELAAKVAAYDPRADRRLIEDAYALAAEAHAPQKREDGQPYIVHPLAVAEILAGYRLDAATIATALLHDTVEDTGVTLPELEKRFGKEVARLVDGVTKLTRLELQSERTKQAENFRKLVLAMSEDIRVLLVKLADRLHNMRTLGAKGSPEKRRKTARETLEIYAPLAERIGMDALKTELETLAFREMNPDAWQTIAARLTYLRGQGADLIEEIEQDLRRVLREAGVEAIEVQGREKSPYSIWLKMQRKNVAFEQLSDIMAFRVIVKDKHDCYAALGAIHSAYRVVPGRFKDWISTPKTNGYQSLHTGVTVPERRNAKIEVQIRTREMHEVAEFGVAAHWVYKQGEQAARDRKRYPWVRDLLEILESAAEPQEFLEHTKLELHRDQVFCFTPKGDLIELPRGATPVDFAYQVHSQVGDNTVGAKVNGKIVPLRHTLENGDQVEIITARGGTPNPAWERFVVTGKARARIRRFVHARQRAEQKEEGRAAIAKAFRAAGLDFSEKIAEPALKPLKQPDFETLCIAVAAGNISPREVLHAAVPELRAPARSVDQMPLARPRGRLGAGPTLTPGKAERPAARREAAMGVTGLVAGMAVHFAGCCHPLPGDRIVGIVTTGRGVTIHKNDCHGLEAFAATPERFIDVDWEYDGGARGGHVGRIELTAENNAGALAGLTTAIARQEGAVNSLRIVNRSGEWCEVLVDVEVRDTGHLASILAALRACPGVTQVERARG
ncbi:bifunctional (p)ppGpp synthetase/guanosine-3',5'-bis(diphosphate) 3'-pyrophosphohydrolase [Roseomonas alkaliterrae]|jgi:GTP pyrophosphokinase|uniref:GTP pyrophosphokinase rsh n=1 Tax=Neoroseomonas alkaliterrae TaxID=1452450 RepID=A0A840XQ67_9PROT|nr:bifunctional (p)ppGpp synthetase/guanosine-3',5'-bis(diphosphate) 3'-pyrophosphohydrolase [Neoroseomonas alkaliterrae]MBB5690056.1 GTP pyrophosphokinase [Neoroseomonas alkaliterrae]MBR0676356.1 bifunctional (p)ppGpp synthetase/guanosine-3',5'-bis(diphosphate) 3'-pyrophosphohydrolase [Neoroseomonas alkaliterrae]